MRGGRSSPNVGSSLFGCRTARRATYPHGNDADGRARGWSPVGSGRAARLSAPERRAACAVSGRHRTVSGRTVRATPTWRVCAAPSTPAKYRPGDMGLRRSARAKPGCIRTVTSGTRWSHGHTVCARTVGRFWPGRFRPHDRRDRCPASWICVGRVACLLQGGDRYGASGGPCLVREQTGPSTVPWLVGRGRELDKGDRRPRWNRRPRVEPTRTTPDGHEMRFQGALWHSARWLRFGSSRMRHPPRLTRRSPDPDSAGAAASRAIGSTVATTTAMRRGGSAAITSGTTSGGTRRVESQARYSTRRVLRSRRPTRRCLPMDDPGLGTPWA